MNMRIMLGLIMLIGILSFPTGLNASTPSAQNGLDIAQSAEDHYLEGLELQATDAIAAQTSFKLAAEGFQAVIDDGANSSAAWFNLGNALLQSGETGESIVAYRKAERLAPSDPDISANLAEARRRVENRIEPDATNLSFAEVSSWWHVASASTRLWIALGAWVAFWVILASRLGRQRNDRRSDAANAGWNIATWGTGVLALVAAGTLAFDAAHARFYPVGVLVNNDVVLRAGNGDGFGAAVEEPLDEGVEFTILEQRPGWWRVELADGTIGWVDASDASSI